jgi:hypothetical protein
MLTAGAEVLVSPRSGRLQPCRAVVGGSSVLCLTCRPASGNPRGDRLRRCQDRPVHSPEPPDSIMAHLRGRARRRRRSCSCSCGSLRASPARRGPRRRRGGDRRRRLGRRRAARDRRERASILVVKISTTRWRARLSYWYRHCWPVPRYSVTGIGSMPGLIRSLHSTPKR